MFASVHHLGLYREPREFMPDLFKIHYIILKSFNQREDVPRGLFSTGFATKVLYDSSCLPCPYLPASPY